MFQGMIGLLGLIIIHSSSDLISSSSLFVSVSTMSSARISMNSSVGVVAAVVG